jgi:hypothetical protein
MMMAQPGMMGGAGAFGASKFGKSQQLDQETIAKLEFILPKLKEHHEGDEEFHGILETASDFLKKGDINNAAEQLNVSAEPLTPANHPPRRPQPRRRGVLLQSGRSGQQEPGR